MGDAVQNPDATIRVAWLLGTDLRPYRVPFLEKLSRVPDLEVVCFYGAAKPGLGAPGNAPIIEDPLVQTRPVINRRWPFGGHRVAWQSGVVRLLIEDFDVLVCPDVIHNLSVWFLATLHKARKRRLVFFGYGYRPTWTGITATTRHWVRRLLLRRADAAIAYTERGRQGYTDAGFDPDRIFVTNNTLDTARLAAMSTQIRAEELGELRSKLGLTHGPTLIFVGRLLPEKRLDVLVEAFRQLKRRLPEVSLLVIGDGPERHLIDSLAANVRDVHPLGSTYDERELAKYFLIADLLVIPGRIGLTCVHGFAYGVPSITTSDLAVPQSPEFAYLEDGQNGVVCELPSASGFFEAIVQLVEDPPRLEAMKAAALKTAEQLTMDKMVNGFTEAVRKAIEPR